MALKDRLQFLIDKEGLNPNQFYVKTGLGNGFLNTVGEKLRKPSVEKIEKSFPHWNIDYIQTGKGEMFKKISSGINVIGDGNVSNTGTISGGINLSADQENKILKKRVKELEDEVKQLKIDKAILQEFVTMLQSKK